MKMIFNKSFDVEQLARVARLSMFMSMQCLFSYSVTNNSRMTTCRIKNIFKLFTLFMVPLLLFTAGDSHATSENLYKFDAGLYKKIQQMQTKHDMTRSAQDAEMPTLSILVNTVNGTEHQLRDILTSVNATNIFVSLDLDFVSADIPIDRISELANYSFVYSIGGDYPLVPLSLNMEQAKEKINADDVPSSLYDYDGTNVTVAVIDKGADFLHPVLMGKQAAKIECQYNGCLPSTYVHDHGTALAAIIAGNGSGDSNDGVAPGALIYDLLTSYDAISTITFSQSLDYAVTQELKVGMSSFATGVGCNEYKSFTMVIDKAVTSGLGFSLAVGRSSGGVQGLACGFNFITVGGVDSAGDHFRESARGPAMFNTPAGDTGRIKPEIVAIAVDLFTATTTGGTGPFYKTQSGVSYSNAFVAGASALILDKRDDYTPLEIKASLLIGADWKASSPATANDYDDHITGVYDKMNKYGFGVLNVEKSLDYANSDDFPNIIYETNPSHENFADKQYRITVDEVDEQVKVLLSWLIHPRGTVINPLLPIQSTTNSTHPGLITPQPFHNQIHDYDVNISNPDDTVIHTSDSDFQNNQFIVFNAAQTGNYVITVSSNSQPRTNLLEPFVIASTHSLDKYPFETPITPTSITFASTLSDDRSRITLQFSERLSKEFVPSDFTISDGTITSIQNSPNSAYRYLQVSSVPYNTDVTVRYTGTTYNLGTGTLELATGTESVATGILIPPPPRPIAISFTDSFQSTLSSWTLSGNNEWETGTPRDSTGQPSGNKVLTSDDCDSQCIISLNSNLDTASPLDITFDRFISRSIDSAEGLYVQYSTDDTRWTTLASYTENNRQDTGRWADTSLTLDITQSTASLRFVAKSSHASEFVEMDNVSISPRVADTTPPTITEPRDMTVEATALLTPVTIETPDVTDGTHPNPTITRTPTKTLFPVGVTVITWTATDSSGNSDTATQIITIQDTTPPTITKPTNKTFEATGEQTSLTSAQIGTATATDLVDSNPTVTSNIPQSFEFNVTATPITWTATDSYGNSDTVTQIITIRDTTSPTITAPADVSFTTTDTSIALTSADYGTATAMDRVDSSPTITSNAPPSFRADRTTTITWTATDDYGNSAHAPQLVTVVHSSLRIFVPID